MSSHVCNKKCVLFKFICNILYIFFTIEFFIFCLISEKFRKKIEYKAIVLDIHGKSSDLGQFSHKRLRKAKIKVLCGTKMNNSSWKVDKNAKFEKCLVVVEFESRRASVIQTLGIVDNHCTKEVRWDVEKLKRGLAWMRNVKQNRQITGEKSLYWGMIFVL